ncbi:MAG TPA: LPS assembly lipoprotein LptE [Pseudomonas sp.]|nr:LPS assembly lipoprotein LptE [Pseudomonas sp.]
MPHRLLLILATALLLGACGFQLRGTGGSEAFALRELDLRAEDRHGEAATQLRALLESRGVRVHPGAPYQLVLLEEQVDQRTASLTSGARSAEYELTSALDYQLRSRRHPLLENRLEVQKVVAHDPNNLIGSEQERQQQRTEMRRDLLQQLVRRLQVLTPAELERLDAQAEARAQAEQRAVQP